MADALATPLMVLRTSGTSSSSGCCTCGMRGVGGSRASAGPN
jgi:hypothetical protein